MKLPQVLLENPSLFLTGFNQTELNHYFFSLLRAVYLVDKGR